MTVDTETVPARLARPIRGGVVTPAIYVAWAAASLVMIVDRWRGVELLRVEHARRVAAEAESDRLRAKVRCEHCRRVARAFGEVEG